MPTWVDDLLLVWAAGDASEIRRNSGYPSVSPAFRDVVSSDEDGESGGYSTQEVRAVFAAVDWLHLAHPLHWRALTRRWRPWLRESLPAHPDEARLAAEAGKLIADYVDQVLG